MEGLNRPPLQLAIHAVENRHAGEQTSHWEKTIKGNYYLQKCMPFVCLVPVQLFSAAPVRWHCTTWMYNCKGLTPQFPFRLQCLPSNKNRSKASGCAFFYSQDIADDYFPAHPAAKISSTLYEYKGALTQLLEGQSYMWKWRRCLLAE